MKKKVTKIICCAGAVFAAVVVVFVLAMYLFDGFPVVTNLPCGSYYDPKRHHIFLTPDATSDTIQFLTTVSMTAMKAKNGDAEAQWQLGMYYIEGHGVPHNEVEGVRWLRRSAGQGNSVGQFLLGLSYFNGKIDCLIDGGLCTLGVESTIVLLSSEPGYYKIIREGALPEEEIKRALGLL